MSFKLLFIIYSFYKHFSLFKMKNIMEQFISFIYQNYDNKNGLGKLNNEVYEMSFLYTLIQIDELVNILNVISNDLQNISSNDIQLAIQIANNNNHNN